MRYINLSLVALLVILSLLFLLTKKEKESPVSTHPPLIKREDLPPSLFAQNVQLIGEGALALQWVTPSLSLPDLHNDLLFYGQNQRPDVKADKPSYHIGLKNDPESKCVEHGERIYLSYERLSSHISDDFNWNGNNETSIKGKYTFSTHNAPTNLWFQISPLSTSQDGVNVIVSMIDETGAEIVSPSHHKQFFLTPTSQRFTFEIDGQRADPSLLSRQKARWMGQDLFLKMHGGEEYSEISSKERLDFLQEDKPYSCFVSEGDMLVWQNGRWLNSKKTRHLPLLVVKKIEERTMQFELWDVEGKSKVILCLIRSHDPALPSLQETFKFVGAKTWAQYIVECDGKRLNIHSNDWLLYTVDGWHKLSTLEEIDAYVSGELIGPLLVFEKMVKEKGSQVLHAHLFNGSRSAVEELVLVSDRSSTHKEIAQGPASLTSINEHPKENYLWAQPYEDIQ